MKPFKLKDLTISITDGKHGDCENQKNSGFYFISCKDVYDGRIHYENARQITEEDFYETHKRTQLEPNDILVTNSGTIGRMALVKDIPETRHTTFQKSVAIVKPNEKVVRPAYLYYALLCSIQQLVDQSNGAAQKNLLLGTMREFSLSIEPDLDRQGNIARTVSVYDDLIENNQKQIKLLEEAAQRLYKEWFIDLRFPGHESTPIVDGLPEGWVNKPLLEVFSFVRGKSYTTKELDDTQGVLLVNLKNIRPFGGYNRNAEKRFIGKYKEEQSLQPGDIIMGVTDMTQERRLVGHVALVPDLKEETTLSMDLIKLIPKCVTKGYLYSIMLFGGLSQQIAPLANGVNVLHLKPEAMMGLTVTVPPGNVMTAYEKSFGPIQARIESLQDQIDMAVQARDRLLTKLVDGKVGGYRG